MDVLRKMEQAGFNVELIEGRLSVTPASKLSPSQDDWIHIHRDELIKAIRLRDLELKPSPSGNDHQAANDDDHARPRVTIDMLPGRLVTCSGCSHAEYRQHPAIVHCRVGVDSGVPAGGWWATDPHPCEKWEGRTVNKTDENAHQGAN